MVRQADRTIAWIGMAALVLRLALFGAAVRQPSRFMIEDDSSEYWRLGTNLAAGRGFVQGEAPPYTPDVRRTPVYPAAVAAAVLVSRGALAGAILLGIAASAATVLLVVRLATRLFGPEAGVWAGLCLALDLTSAAYANQLLTEAVFTLLLTASAGALIQSAGSDYLAAVEGGVLAGLAALCRPIGLLASLALWPAGAWRARNRALALFFVSVAASALLVAVWAWRNKQVSGVTTVSSIAATNAYFHRAAYVQAYLTHQRVEPIRFEWEREFSDRAATWTERERMAWLSSHGLTLILEHPGVYGLVWMRGILRMLQPDDLILPRLLGIGSTTIAWRLVHALAWIQVVGLYAIAVYGAFRVGRSKRLAVAIPLAVIAYFVAVGGPEMYSRFRVPIMPAVCMLAGAGIHASGMRGLRVGRS